MEGIISGPSFETFYRREFPQVYRATHLLMSDDEAAMDATQEAFQRAHARWRRLSRHPWAGGWVMTTALNECRRQLRRHPSISATADPSKGNRGSSSDPGVRIDVSNALRRLPPRQREAVVLFYVGDLPLGAIADLMSISEGAVKAHLAQGRKALRGLLEMKHV